VKQLQRLPRDRQEQISHAIDDMETNPLQGNVRPVKSGKFQGTLRKRVGRYRVIFSVNVANHIVKIAAILIRDEKTYR